MHVLRGDNDRIVSEDCVSLRSMSEPNPPREKGFISKIKKVFQGTRRRKGDPETRAGIDDINQLSTPIAQHYNPDRNIIYEGLKSSRETNFSVVVEQVSIFLNGDGTVISFFQVFTIFSALNLAILYICSCTHPPTFSVLLHYSSNVRGPVAVTAKYH
jgi:hypothetical protein